MFIINWGELDGRVNPSYYMAKKTTFLNHLRKTPFICELRSLIYKSAYGILPPGDCYNENNPISLIRATEMNADFKIDFNNSLKVPEVYGTSERATLKKGDVLIAVKGATIASNKSVCYIDKDIKNTIINGSIFKFQVNYKSNYLYISYILSLDIIKKQMKYQLIANNAVDYLDKSLINRLLIPVPPKPIQQQIIDIMDNAYAEKQQKEKQAQDLLDSINGYLLGELGIAMPSEEENTLESRKFYANSADVLGGRFDPFYNKPIFEKNLENIQNCKNGITTLKNIAKNGLTKGILPNDAQKDGDCKVVQITNINNDGSIDTTSNLLAKPIYSSKHELKIGDILIVITGATIGKIGFWDYSGEYYLGGDIVKFNTGNFLLNEIYSALLRTTPYQLQLKKCITGATNGHLSPTDIERLPLPIMNNDEVVENMSAHLSSIRSKAKQLEQEADDAVKSAKAQVEKILLEGSL